MAILPLGLRLKLLLLDFFNWPVYYAVMWPVWRHHIRRGTIPMWDLMGFDILWKTEPHYIDRLALWNQMQEQLK